MKTSFVAMIGLCVAAFLLSANVGCGPTANDMDRTVQAYKDAATSSPMPAEYSNAVNELIAMMKDQGVLDEFMANARAHGINPGVKVAMGEEKWIKVGLDGVDADVEARIEGTGTQLPSGVRQVLIDQIAKLEGRTDPEAEALRAKILDILGWNRVESPHNPIP